MVIGNGMIAQAFESYRDKDRFIIFASGVSDSTNTQEGGFEREKQLLLDTITRYVGKQIVYFSTCSIYDASLQHSPYVIHKKNMEQIITENHNSFTIFRVSNPVGNTKNTTTLINYFIKKIIDKQPFEAWANASRNIIDIDDMYVLCNDLLASGAGANTTVNIANPENYPIPYIIKEIEIHLKAKGNYTLITKGASPHIDISPIESLFRKFNITFGYSYFPNLLQKYFPV